MTNKRSTRSALLSSVIALFLCFVMLLGTTYAWFTDSVTSANNIIKSGTLEIAMDWADGKTDPANTTWTDASVGAIFNYDNWEPGYVDVKHIKIANEGSLALKYQVMIVANGEVSDLADVIDVYYADPAVQITDRSMLTEDNKLGTLTEVLAGLNETGSGKLLAGKNDTVTIAFKMQESAGNEYQNKSIGSTFSIVLLATQLTAEPDSFDDQYDKDSLYPEVAISNVTKEEGVATAVKTEEEDVKIDIPEGAPAGNYDLEVSNKTTTTDAEGNTTLSMDISLKKDGVKVADDGTTVYTVSVDVGAGLNLTKVLHDGTEITDYEYDIVTGIITFETAHFSPFVFTYQDAGYAAVTNGKCYDTFADAIADALQAGGTVTLLDNVVLENAINVPAGITLTLDLNGKSISHSYECTASYAMITNKGNLTVKDSVGGGKISFTDTGAGDPTFGWGSYTIHNTGSLVVEGGTIEHLGEQDFATHCILAIFQYSGSTVINGGTISCPRYRPVRLWKGEMTINGGTFDGQVWVHCVDDSAELTVNGGSFSPNGQDGSSLFVNNKYDGKQYQVKLSVTGGEFATKLGSNIVIANSVTGGTFGADPSAYVASGYGATEKDGAWTVDVKVYEVSTMPELVNAVKDGAIVIDAKNADLGDFYYDVVFQDGTVVKNAKFSYFYGGGAEGTVTFENCEFVSDHSYSAHFDNGGGSVIFNECLFDGWNSFGDAIKNIEMNDCTFQKSYNYDILRFYQNAQINGCTFADAFEGIDSGEVSGHTIELNDCKGIDEKIYNNTKGSTVYEANWIVDGVELADVPQW